MTTSEDSTLIRLVLEYLNRDDFEGLVENFYLLAEEKGCTEEEALIFVIEEMLIHFAKSLSEIVKTSNLIFISNETEH